MVLVGGFQNQTNLICTKAEVVHDITFDYNLKGKNKRESILIRSLTVITGV